MQAVHFMSLLKLEFFQTAAVPVMAAHMDLLRHVYLKFIKI